MKRLICLMILLIAWVEAQAHPGVGIVQDSRATFFIPIPSQRAEGELALLRQHLKLPASAIILYAEGSDLPAEKTIKVFRGTGLEEKTRQSHSKWIDKWNQQNSGAARRLEVVSELQQADVILSWNIRWPDAETEFKEAEELLDPKTLRPVVRSPGGVKVTVPVIAHIIVKSEEKFIVVWSSRRIESGKTPRNSEREMYRAFALLLKRL